MAALHINSRLQVAAETARADHAQGEVAALQQSLSQCGDQITSLQDLLRSSSDHSEPAAAALVNDLHQLDAQLSDLRSHSRSSSSLHAQQTGTGGKTGRSTSGALRGSTPAAGMPVPNLLWQKRTDTAKRSEQGNRELQCQPAQLSKQLREAQAECTALHAANAQLRAQLKAANLHDALELHTTAKDSPGRDAQTRPSWTISASPAEPGGSDAHEDGSHVAALAAVRADLAAEQQMRAQLEITSGQELAMLRQQVHYPLLRAMPINSVCHGLQFGALSA